MPIQGTIGFTLRCRNIFSLKTIEVAAVVAFVLTAVTVLALVVRESAPQKIASAPPPPPSRLIAGFAKTDGTGTMQGQSLHVLDPDTLADVVGTSPLDTGACGTGPLVDPHGRAAVVATNGGTNTPITCPQVSALQLRLIDLETWSWGREIDLEDAADRTLQLAWTPASSPILWSPDGSRLYVFTVSRTRDWVTSGRNADETREVWIVDAAGAAPPTPIPLDAAVWRADFAPTGQAVNVLGYQTRGPSQWGYFEPGSTVLLILDPNTGVTRARIPLPGVKVAAVAGMSRLSHAGRSGGAASAKPTTRSSWRSAR